MAGPSSFPADAVLRGDAVTNAQLVELLEAIGSPLPTTQPIGRNKAWLNSGVYSLTDGYVDIEASVPYTAFFAPNFEVYKESSGAVGTLTPAVVGDPVGTWRDRSQTYTVRAPSDSQRMTLRADSSGQRYLERTAGNQWYVSDALPATWSFLHNGSTYSVALSFRQSDDSADANFPLIGTNSGSSSQVGFLLSYDDRSSISAHHRIQWLVSNGTGGQQPVLHTGQPGVAGGRWNRVVAIIDPDHATAADRLKFWSFGRKGGQNTNAFGVSVNAPATTLTLGQTGGSTADRPLGYFGGFIIYQGSWTEAERNTVEDFFDIGGKGRYSITSAVANVSGQARTYEAFPAFLQAQNGNYIGLYRSASTHISLDGTIARAMKPEGSSVWTVKPDWLTDATTGLDLRDTNGVVLSSGKIILASGLFDDNVGTVDDTIVFSSTDHGETATEIARISPTGASIFIRPYGDWHELSDGTVIAPMYQQGPVSEIWQTSDEGLTWSLRSTVGTDLNETEIINLSGSNWLAVARRNLGSTVGQLYWTLSSDDCQTWGTLTDSGLEGVSPRLFKVGSTVYCATGDRTAPGGIRILVWTDNLLHGEGSGWLVYTATAVNGDVGYPAIRVDGQKVMMLLYDENSIASPGIQYMEFNLPDFGSVL